MTTIHPTAACLRCGIERRVNPERGIAELCRDCVLVERDLAALEDWHGTNAGYCRHLYRREIACAACLEGHRRHSYEWRKRTGRPVRQFSPCGTYAAFRAHQRRGETPCDPCLEAGREYQRAYHQTVRRTRRTDAA